MRLAAIEAKRQKAERARELNAQHDAVTAQKAIMAQIVQTVHQSRQSKGEATKLVGPEIFSYQ